MDRHLTGDGWLVLDIDQTLLRSPRQWGSEPWYYHRIAVHRAAGHDEQTSTVLANDEWEAAQGLLTPVAMERDIAAHVRRWQGARQVLGLTARRIEIAELTRRHLAGLGIDLALTAPERGRREVLPDAVYEHGIFYVGPLHRKGSLFRRFLESGARRPAALVFVDDRHEHVRSMGEEMAALGIPCAALRYSAGDRFAREFDPAIAEREARDVARR